MGWVLHGAVIPAQHGHFHRRLLKRCGSVLAPGEFGLIVKDIRKGRSVLIEQRSRKHAIYSFRIKRAQERIYVLASSDNAA